MIGFDFDETIWKSAARRVIPEATKEDWAMLEAKWQFMSTVRKNVFWELARRAEGYIQATHIGQDSAMQLGLEE